MPKIFGRNTVLEALKAGKRSVEKIFLAQNATGPKIQKIISIANDKNIQFKRIPKEELDLITQNACHQGVLAIVQQIKNIELSHILAHLKQTKTIPFFLLVDKIEDPRNLGSIIRTASAAGVHAVIIPKRKSSKITETVAKSSAGGIEYVNIIQVSNMANCCRILKKNGIWIVGSDSEAKDLWFQIDTTLPIAIILGGENRGLSQLIRSKCDFLVSMPMKSAINSLNVSVACGVLLYEVVRQRQNWLTNKVNFS